MDKKMILVCDIGNTHIVLGVYESDKLLKFWRIQSSTHKTEDEFFVSFKLFLNEINLSINDISGAVISSVVPILTEVFNHLFWKYFHLKPIIVSSKLDLGISYDKIKRPLSIGGDLIANAFAAHKIYGDKNNCIVVDFGTATTIQLISQKREFYGTVISPGVQTSSESLFKIAAQLGQIKLDSPKKVIGDDTRSAMLSGIVFGAAIMADGFIKKIKMEYSNLDGNFCTIATGGISDLICKHTKSIEKINKNLTLQGLQLIYCHLKGIAYTD